ncbi:MAG: radical SAM protein [Candidatus Omnitrophica bacterium]|nr:radical SAM protein [Candidatus Omnitrophota bacterium]
MYPAYLKLHQNGKLTTIIEESWRILKSCTLCPRRCQVNRLKNELGFCRTGLNPKVCSFMLHHGEEPAISGKQGSGTIFFSGCNMACIYCQNYEFSQQDEGSEVNLEELAYFMLQLQEMGAHNINLVTPTHIMPQILKGLQIAITKGLKIPLVYNTGGYELPEIIKLLTGIVDIYLPDMRYADPEMAKKYSSAPDYPKYNQASVKEMQRQVGVAQIDSQGIIKRGLVIRHLVLPGGISGTEKIMQFIAREISPDTYISLMSQYFPCYQAGQFNEINRRISAQEYLSGQKAMETYGLHNGWVQDEYGMDRYAGINIKPSIKNDA